MNFKEHIANDISKTIINTDEFAIDKKINGVKVRIVEDSDELEYRIKKNYDGLIIGDVLFFISEKEYKKIPRVTTPPTSNQTINYDGRPALIINVGKSESLYEIIIQYTGG
jgi:hypothetical protein